MFEGLVRRANGQRKPSAFDTDFLTSYLESLAAEKAASITELQNATTWGITIITTGALFLLGRSQFPDFTSLLGLLILAVLATHFTTRAAKGYINVVRWSLIQRTLLSALTDGKDDFTEFRHALNTYHLGWALPLRRRDIAWKALVELGFGYIFMLLLGAVAYCFVTIHLKPLYFIAVAVAVLFSGVDIFVFARSPYMRRAVPSPSARRLR